MNLMLAMFVAMLGIIIFGVLYERLRTRSNYIPIEDVRGFEYLKDLDRSTVKEWVHVDGTVTMPDGTVKKFGGEIPKLDNCKNQDQVEHDLYLIASYKNDPKIMEWLKNFNATMENKLDEEIYEELHKYAESLRKRE